MKPFACLAIAAGRARGTLSREDERILVRALIETPRHMSEALAIEPHHHIVTIASGGCNVLSYLTANPSRITAVDLNRAHVNFSTYS